MHLLGTLLGVVNMFAGLIACVFVLVMVGIGIGLGLVAAALAAVLLGFGVISSSVFVGVRSGRAGSGIRAFLLQIGVLVGIPAGAVCAWLGKSIFEAYSNLHGWTVLAYGAIGGAIAGVLVALMMNFIAGRISLWAGGRLGSFREKHLSSSNARYRNTFVQDVK
jgi:hypothetical protein